MFFVGYVSSQDPSKHVEATLSRIDHLMDFPNASIAEKVNLIAQMCPLPGIKEQSPSLASVEHLENKLRML